MSVYNFSIAIVTVVQVLQFFFIIFIKNAIKVFKLRFSKYLNNADNYNLKKMLTNCFCSNNK